MDTVLDLAAQQIARVRARPLSEQQREKAPLWERAQEIFNGANGENRPMSADERARYDELTGLIADINQREQDERAHQEQTRRLGEPQRNQRMLPGAGSADDEAADEYRSAFDSYIRAFRQGELTSDTWQALRGRRASLSDGEQRALGTTIGANGGYLVPTSFQANLIETMKAFAPVESIVTPLETSGGEDIEWPTNDDTSNEGAVVAENADVGNATDLAFGTKTLRAYLYTSKVAKVPFTLLQDSAVDVDALIARTHGTRLGRIFAKHFVTGTGVNQMEGITVGGATGKSFASATAITYVELIDLEHSVDPAYRDASRCRYLFNDATFAALRKLQDDDHRPLWVPWLGQGVAGAVPSTFNGWNYTVVPAMPAMTTGLASVAFGDFDRGYKYRRVTGFSLVRIEERYVEYGQVGFLLFARADGRVVDTSAFKLGVQA